MKTIICSICNQGHLLEYNKKPLERCDYCLGKARHRVAHYLYQKHFQEFKGQGAKCLHLAPEKSLYPILNEIFGDGYTPADGSPERYPHVQATKMFLPQDFSKFPKEHFSAIIHNHMMEHVPGSYKEHIDGFLSLLKPQGLMIFSVPGPYMEIPTKEGGEFLKTDQERTEQFNRYDHFKIFGFDFVDHLKSLKSVELLEDGITNPIRSSLNVRPNKAPFFLLRKKVI